MNKNQQNSFPNCHNWICSRLICWSVKQLPYINYSNMIKTKYSVKAFNVVASQKHQQKFLTNRIGLQLAFEIGLY